MKPAVHLEDAVLSGAGSRQPGTAQMQWLLQAPGFKSPGLKLFHLGGFLPSIWYGIITKC